MHTACLTGRASRCLWRKCKHRYGDPLSYILYGKSQWITRGSRQMSPPVYNKCTVSPYKYSICTVHLGAACVQQVRAEKKAMRRLVRVSVSSAFPVQQMYSIAIQTQYMYNFTVHALCLYGDTVHLMRAQACSGQA